MSYVRSATCAVILPFVFPLGMLIGAILSYVNIIT